MEIKIDWEKVANASKDCFEDDEIDGLAELVRQMMEKLGEHYHLSLTHHGTSVFPAQPFSLCDCAERKRWWPHIETFHSPNCPACLRRLPT